MAKNEYGYMAKIGGDTSGLELALRETEQELKEAENGLKALDKTISEVAKNGGDTSELLAARERAYIQYADMAQRQLGLLADVQTKVDEAFTNGAILAGDYASYMAKLADATERVNQTQQELDPALKNIEDSQNALSQSTKETTDSTVKFGDILKANVISDLTVKSIEKATDAIKQFGDELKNIVISTASYGDTVDKQSQRLGMTTEAYQEWTYILSQNGANISTLTAGMRTLTNQIDSAESGGKAASSAFEKLGLSAEKLSDLSGEQQFSAVVTALQSMTDETERNALANDLLGRSYQQLIPLLNQDSDNVERLRQRAHDTNQILSEDGITAAVNYTDAMDTLTKSIDGFKHRLGEQVLPILTEFIDTITDTINGVSEDKIQNMLKKIADGAQELAGVIQKFISDGGIEKIIDFFDWIIDHADEIVTVLKFLAGAWGVSKIAGFCEQLGKIPGLITKVSSSIAGLPGQISSVETAFGNIGTAAANGMNTITTAVSGAEATVTVSLGAIAAAATAAVAAIASAIAIADELDTITDAMTYKSVEAEKSKKNVEEITNSWDNLESMQGIDRYNAAVEYKENILAREENWNKRYKSVIDELNELQEKKFKTAPETARQIELQNTKDTLDAEYAMLELYGTKVNNELSNYSSETVRRLQEAEAAQNQSISKAGQTNADALAAVWENIRTATEKKMNELDSQLATHKISDNEYWSKRKEYLEAHRDEENEQWWKWYDEVTEHYEKLSETEKKAADDAAKEARETFESEIQSRWEAAERSQKENGESDQWLADEYKKIVDELDEGTDLYYKYYDKWLDKTVKIAEDTEKAAKETAKEEVAAWERSADEVSKAVEKKYSDVQKAFEKSKSDYISGLDLLVTEESETDSQSKALRTAKAYQGNEKNTEKKQVLADINEQTEKLREYRKNMEKLESTGIPSEYLEKIRAMDLDSRMEYVSELVKLRPEKLQKHYADISEYYKEAHLAGLDDTRDMKAEADSYAAEAGNSILTSWRSLSPSAYEAGKDAAKAYIDGFSENMELTNSLLNITSPVSAKNSAVQQNTAYASGGETKNTAALSAPYSAYEYPAPSTPVTVTINIAPQVKKVVNTTVEEFLSNIRNGGGSINV
ncbi:MAG: hypothetical protein NC120_12060 [Ruminococcus sp.]|nr:hypothetical protein [Ruminococcus sp.]